MALHLRRKPLLVSVVSLSPEEERLGRQLLSIYHLLLERYGPQHWWPGETPFEVVVGAILTQSAAWGNVEKAVANLKAAGALSPPALRSLSEGELARLIYPSGYYNAKARKLLAFVRRLGEGFHDSLEELLSLGVEELRAELLSIYGIGEETADSIILYAAGKPVFVVDAYTHRIMRRLGLRPMGYSSLQAFFHCYLPRDVALFNEYHALFVRHGKEVCRKKPLCSLCCLNTLCPYPAVRKEQEKQGVVNGEGEG